MTGSYDPDLNLLYWGVGNAAADLNAALRRGDNLYTDSVVALDADTGKLEWYFHFVAHQVRDWDATQVPVLVDDKWHGQPRKLIYSAHRGGFYHVLDRAAYNNLGTLYFHQRQFAPAANA